jgi:DNA-binding NarL/FixJ family response regulator
MKSDPALMYSLTRREKQVLVLLGRGWKNADIAVELQVSTETVRTHAQHVYRKLGVRSRKELLGVEPYGVKASTVFSPNKSPERSLVGV